MAKIQWKRTVTEDDYASKVWQLLKL